MGPIEEIKGQVAQSENKDADLELWLVCFTGRLDERYWWDKIGLTDRPFRHCYAIQYQKYTDRWVLVDWKTGLCDVMVFYEGEMPYIFNQLQASEGTAVLIKKRKIEKEIHYRIPFIYCVQAVLQLLGLPTRWTFTPKQLYKRLILAGGEELINHRSTDDGRRQRWRWKAHKRTEGNQRAAEGDQRADA
jgi:hypothetical protein